MAHFVFYAPSVFKFEETGGYEMKNRTSFRNASVKSPVTAFPKCPECESTNLLKFGGEVFCKSCPWDSIAAHMEAGAGDNWGHWNQGNSTHLAISTFTTVPKDVANEAPDELTA
jgi:hypothetical protein